MWTIVLSKGQICSVQYAVWIILISCWRIWSQVCVLVAPVLLSLKQKWTDSEINIVHFNFSLQYADNIICSGKRNVKGHFRSVCIGINLKEKNTFSLVSHFRSLWILSQMGYYRFSAELSVKFNILMKMPHFLSVMKIVYRFIRLCGLCHRWNILICHLFVLVCRHSNKFCLRKQIGFECAVRKFDDVVGSNDMKPRLIFVHGV